MPTPSSLHRRQNVETELSNNTTVAQSIELQMGDSVSYQLVIRVRRPLSCTWAYAATYRTCDLTGLVIMISSCVEMATVGTLVCFFREAILMMELPRRHAASLERAAGSHPIRVQSMGGGRGRGLTQMIYSSSGLLRGSVWQMRRLWLAAHQTPLACFSISWYQSCLVCGKRQWGLEQGSLSKWCRDIRNKV